MWANWEVAALAEWLKDFNQRSGRERKVGFYGLDVYSLWESLDTIIKYLEKHDGKAIGAAYEAFQCFEPYHEDPQRYARATAMVPTDCEEEVVKMLRRIQEKPEIFEDAETEFNMEQNARVAVNAEKYYRAMIRGGAGSWNIRDRHMMETLENLLEYQKGAKVIIWEHNTHVGDARYTDMRKEDMVNVGQLVREKYGEENVFIAGFGTNHGTVIAGEEWDAPMQEMEVPSGRKGSWESKLHNISTENKLILSRDLRSDPDAYKWIGHRAIGVVYHPEYEAFGNYVPSEIHKRYDAFLFIDETRALHPLHIHPDVHEAPDLYPWNF
jgi:erythromycin esterase-like protein